MLISLSVLLNSEADGLMQSQCYRAITEDRDFTARYALVDNTYVINVEPLNQSIYRPDPQTQPPERPLLGLGGFLREYLGVQPYEDAAKKLAGGKVLKDYERPYQLLVEPYDPKARDEYVIGVNIEIAWYSAGVAAKYADSPPPELDQDDIEEFFRKVCAVHVCEGGAYGGR
jgi:hypothetical protein